MASIEEQIAALQSEIGQLQDTTTVSVDDEVDLIQRQIEETQQQIRQSVQQQQQLQRQQSQQAAEQQQQPAKKRGRSFKLKVKGGDDKRKSVVDTTNAAPVMLPVEVMNEQEIMDEINQLEAALKAEYEAELQKINDNMLDSEMKKIEAEIEATAAKLLQEHSKATDSDEKLCATCLQLLYGSQKHTYIECDTCHLNYHLGCIGLTPFEAQFVKAYHCTNHDGVHIEWQPDFDQQIADMDVDDFSAAELEQHLAQVQALIERMQRESQATSASPNKKGKKIRHKHPHQR